MPIDSTPSSEHLWTLEDQSTETTSTPLTELDSLPDPFDGPSNLAERKTFGQSRPSASAESLEQQQQQQVTPGRASGVTPTEDLSTDSEAKSRHNPSSRALRKLFRRSGVPTSPVTEVPSPPEVPLPFTPLEPPDAGAGAGPPLLVDRPQQPTPPPPPPPPPLPLPPATSHFAGHRNTPSDASNRAPTHPPSHRITHKTSSGSIRQDRSAGKRVQSFFSARGPSLDTSQSRTSDASAALAPPLRPLRPMESSKPRSSGWKLGFGKKNGLANPVGENDKPKSRGGGGGGDEVARVTADFDALLGHGVSPKSGRPPSDAGAPPSPGGSRSLGGDASGSTSNRRSWNNSELEVGSYGASSSRTPDATTGSLSASASSVSAQTSSVSGRRSKLERLVGDGIPGSVGSATRSRSLERVAGGPPGHAQGSSTVGRASPASAAANLQSFRIPQQPPSTQGPSPRSESRDSPTSGRGGSTSMRASPTDIQKDATVDCPVCLEPLSYRLADERPHVIPSCGHALHNACFTAVYGPVTAVLAAQKPQRGEGDPGTPSAPGMCGVCRKPIVLGTNPEEGFRKQNKLMGVEDEDGGSSQGFDDMHSTFGDDQLEANAPRAARPFAQMRSEMASVTSTSMPTFVSPFIKARAEYKTIYRSRSGQNAKQNVVCVVSIEVPTRRPQAPAPFFEDPQFGNGNLGTIPDQVDDEIYDAQGPGPASPRHPLTREHLVLAQAQSVGSGSVRAQSFTDEGGRTGSEAGGLSGKTRSARDRQNSNARSQVDSDDEDAGFSFGATPAAGGEKGSQADKSPFQAVMDDLQHRVTDWKGHSMDHFGPLILHDYLSVRQETVVREFYVYLFREALLCVSEERKKGLARFIPGATGSSTVMPGSDGSPMNPVSKAALKLKGRIYLRHIRRVLDSTSSGENSLSIKMDDDNLDHFVLCFKTPGQLEVWRQQMSELIEQRRKQRAQQQRQQQQLRNAPSEPPSAPLPPSEAPPDYQGVMASRPGNSSLVSQASGKAGSIGPSTASSPVTTAVSRRSMLANRRISTQPTPLLTEPQHQQWSASGGLDPSQSPPPMLPHAPVDLVVMVSVPASLRPQTSASVTSSAALKLRLIRSSLEFIAQHLGPRDRIAVITYTVGVDGDVRRTALLNPAREQSRATLQQFIASVGQPWDSDQPDPFREDLAGLGGTSDRTDTITAVNVGLDIVLKRKTKNPVTGMLLIHDTVDGPRSGGQMDLVKARAEAAKVAIHCFGYGKSHDPSSLWLISHNTRGSYTFVKEWYGLRECLAGCIGSLMSVALTDLKIHISVPDDNHFRVRKVAGLNGAIVGATGKTVDVELNELRFGETRELFIELDLDFGALVSSLSLEKGGGGGGVASGPSGGGSGARRRSATAEAEQQSSATDDFMQRMGLPNLSLAEADMFDASADQPMIEEVAVLEANAGFKDPATGVSVPSVSIPTVLTVEVDARNSDPAAEGSPSLAAALADPIVTRRRLEILVSDMITHSLVVSSRKNYAQALKILSETRRIVDTVVQAIPTVADSGVGARTGSVDSATSTLSRRGSSTSRGPRRLREAQNRRTSEALVAILEDLDALVDGLETQHTAFDRDLRNFGAQQAMVLRDQQAWTTRSDTEYRHFWADNGPAFTARSAAFSSYSQR